MARVKINLNVIHFTTDGHYVHVADVECDDFLQFCEVPQIKDHVCIEKIPFGRKFICGYDEKTLADYDVEPIVYERIVYENYVCVYLMIAISTGQTKDKLKRVLKDNPKLEIKKLDRVSFIRAIELRGIYKWLKKSKKFVLRY